jgi:hypothetical protein
MVAYALGERRRWLTEWRIAWHASRCEHCQAFWRSLVATLDVVDASTLQSDVAELRNKKAAQL